MFKPSKQLCIASAIFAALLCGYVDVVCAQQISTPDPVLYYLDKSKRSLSSWSAIVKIEHKRQSADALKPVYEAARDAARNEDQRRALAKHWSMLRRCTSDLGDGYDQFQDFYARDRQRCVDELDQRAALVLTAAITPS